MIDLERQTQEMSELERETQAIRAGAVRILARLEAAHEADMTAKDKRIAELEAENKTLVSELASLATEFWIYMSGNSKDYYKTLLEGKK